jgi:hypothetical protein
VPEPWQLLLTVVVGVGTGVLSGMFGVGGAVISTPAILALGATPLEAVGSTLPSIIPGAVAGGVRYEREGMIDHRVAWRTGVAGMAFATLGAIASKAIPGKGHVQMILTALLLGWFAFRTARDSDPAVEPADHELHRGLWLLVAIGAMAGGLSGFLGVGGGIIMVPAFTNWVGLPLKRAIATSLVCVGLVCIPGTITHQLLGDIDWWFALPLMVAAIPGARVGAHLAIRASDRALRISVASVLGTIAIVYGVVELVALVS